MLTGTGIRVVRPSLSSPSHAPLRRPASLSVSLTSLLPALFARPQNAICPGLIETGMTTFTFDRARERGTLGKVGQLNPLRRCVGALLAYLSSLGSS